MGIREGIEITEKGNLVVGKIVMGQDPISLVPVNVGIIHVSENPVGTQTIHVHGSPIDVRNIHVHGKTQTGVQIP